MFLFTTVVPQLQPSICELARPFLISHFSYNLIFTVRLYTRMKNSIIVAAFVMNNGAGANPSIPPPGPLSAPPQLVKAGLAPPQLVAPLAPPPSLPRTAALLSNPRLNHYDYPNFRNSGPDLVSKNQKEIK